MISDIQISVVIPTYNREKTIKRCINSILNQTCLPYEIIVVDDGSTDNTISVIKNMDCQLVKIFEQDHKGAQAARNRGITEARGNYIALLDSDDEWLPNLVETYLAYIENKPEAVLYSDCILIDEKLHTKTVWKVSGESGHIYKKLLVVGGPMFDGMLCKKSILYDIGLLDENVPSYQEWETSIRLSKVAEFLHIHEPLFVYYRHLGDTISKDKIRDIKGIEYIIEKHKEEIITECGHNALIKRYENLLERSLRADGYDINKYFEIWLEAKCTENPLYTREEGLKELGISLYKKYTDSDRLTKLFYKWVCLKQKGINIEQILINRGYMSIAIYGMNYVGEAFVNELSSSSILIKYGIDRRVSSISSGLRIITPNEIWEAVDAVIVTAVAYYDEIYSLYSDKVGAKIVSLEEIINEHLD